MSWQRPEKKNVYRSEDRENNLIQYILKAEMLILEKYSSGDGEEVLFILSLDPV